VSTTRRVRRVRLAAPRADLARRGALLLEDALRTATVPGAEDGRLLLVRSLDVGRLDPRSPPASVALAVERRLRLTAASAVSADDPAAESAVAVRFSDPVHAHAALALRICRGDPCAAWFWPAAVPAWTPTMAPAEGLAAVIRSAAALPCAVAAVAEVIRAAVDGGAGDRLAAALPAAAAREVLRVFGAVEGAGGAVSPPAADLSGGTGAGGLADAADVAAAALPVAAATLLARWVPRWTAADPRSVLLTAALLVAARPARAGDRGLARRAALLASRVETGAMARTSADPTPAAASPETGAGGAA
jgi:hypothetical protein